MKAVVLAVLLTFPLSSLAAEKASFKRPAEGPIRVAFVLTDGATMIDFAGPWEVFQDVMVGDDMPFQLYTVGESRNPISTSGGMKVVPDYSFDDAPQPHIVVVGAQRGSPKMPDWLRKVAPKSDVMMSVCTGAFKFADAGLLDGKTATTHHDFYDRFAERYPKVKLVKSTRFVQSDPKTFTAGGLTSGIDLALHVVEAYFGRATAEQTATYMEYESTGWKR
jgi:transcriptional regulator GlxA family with amidase domain